MFNPQFCDKDHSNLWKMFLIKDPYTDSDLKDILHPVDILLVLPISAAGCERMVSSQNRIKSSIRASLKTSSLEGLIRISAQGPSVEEFDPLIFLWSIAGLRLSPNDNNHYRPCRLPS